MSEQKPSIGRIVIFNDWVVQGKVVQQRAAIITKLEKNGDGEVYAVGLYILPAREYETAYFRGMVSEGENSQGQWQWPERT